MIMKKFLLIAFVVMPFISFSQFCFSNETGFKIFADAVEVREDKFTSHTETRLIAGVPIDYKIYSYPVGHCRIKNEYQHEFNFDSRSGEWMYFWSTSKTGNVYVPVNVPCDARSIQLSPTPPRFVSVDFYYELKYVENGEWKKRRASMFGTLTYDNVLRTTSMKVARKLNE